MFIDKLIESTGHLQIKGIYKTGEVILLHQSNLVVNNARHMLVQLLGGKRNPAYAQKFFITHMAMGDGADPINPPTPDSNSKFLINEKVKLEITDIEMPSENTIKFSALMDDNTGNNITFSEAALIADAAPLPDEKMFAIKHHGGILKSAELMLEYNWTIVF